MYLSTDSEDFSSVEPEALPQNIESIIDNAYLFDIDDEFRRWRDSIYILVGEERE